MQKSSGTISELNHQSPKTHSFKDLIAWQRAMQLAFAVYKLTAEFPPEERYGLSGQMRRAAVSCASNVAEGYSRSTTGELKYHIGVARGENAELQTQILIAKGLYLGSPEAINKTEQLANETGKLLTGFLRALKK